MSKHEELKARLAKAVVTLHNLPQSAHLRPMGYKTAWPEMMRKTKRGAILHRGTAKYIPNSADISDCYKIIDALYRLSEMQRALLWARAMNIGWQLLQNRYHRSRTHLNRLYGRALIGLDEALQKPRI